MKHLLNNSSATKKYFVFVMLFLSQSLVWAQDKKVDVSLSVDKGGSEVWYTQPWMWVIGGAVFILLLVALLRGGGKKD